VLAEAIQRGVVITSKIANPKPLPIPPTIRLNRAEPVCRGGAALHPVTSHGDSIAEAIEENGGPVSCYFLEATAFAKLFVQDQGTGA